MPEAKKYDYKKIELPDVDWETFVYKDKQREKHRKEGLKSDAHDQNKDSSLSDKKRASSTAWSGKNERKAAREVKRTKREAKRNHLRSTKMTEDEKKHVAETQGMVAHIRQQQLRTESKEEVFEGFE